MQQFWDRVRFYADLSEKSKAALEGIMKKRTIKKNDFFINNGQVPRNVGFVLDGLFSQYFTAENGDVIIKRFFPENFFVASISATLTNSPSNFTIRALETSVILEYDFSSFKKLVTIHSDIAAFYIKYMEIHWIIEKEPLEISFRYDNADDRYMNFLKAYPTLESRLKQHEIASYVGVTPTQLSRIRGKK